jgi:uncharacterized membrane protein
MFEFLFKFRYAVFEKGHVAFRYVWPWPVTVALALGIVAYAWYAYRHSPLAPRWRALFVALRAAALALIILMLHRPVLVLRSVIPQKNFLAVAYDTSKSMEIRDEAGGRTRTDVVGALLAPGQNGLLDELSRKFRLRFFRFSGGAERTAAFDRSARPGNRTDLERTMDQVAGELAGVPVSGLVLLTDGADNSSSNLSSSTARMKARGIPVYPVGVGRPAIPLDAEIVRVSAPRKTLKDSLIETDVAVRSTGYAGRRSKLQVREGKRVLQSTEIQLGGDEEVRTHKLNFSSDTAGPHVFSFRIEPLEGETVPENNESGTLVRVEDLQPQILYVEGEPRWIYGFLRRSAGEDKNLRLVTLLRQADGKFLRQGIESGETLAKGFPSGKAELFGYKALILGSVEATFFTFDQLRLISDFVGERGGGLLALGGRNSFAQGGYLNTPLEDVLPLNLRGGGAAASGFQDIEFKLRLTDYGAEHPVTRMSMTEADSRKRWDSAPALVGLNPSFGPKPGATVLAEGLVGSETRQGPAALTFQRFGKGRVMALTTASTWRWKMELDHRDNFHDQFWKQLLRWLVSEVPESVSASTSKPTYSIDEPVGLRADVHDASFLQLNDAGVTARIKAPSGETAQVPLSWDVSKDGQYTADFAPRELGIHELELEATRNGRSLGTSKTSFLVAESNEEYHNAALNEGLLRRIAGETGGHYYRAADVRTLPEDLSFVDGGAARLEEKELWDMPVLFLLLVGLLVSEWLLRKRKGLA